MQTDSEELMRQGVAAGAETFERFLAAAGWEPEDIDCTFCHQVGVAHRKLMFESLRPNPEIDFATVETLGNTGSAALPVQLERCLRPNPVTVRNWRTVTKLVELSS